MESGSAQSGPRSGGRILDLGFSIYFRNFGRFVAAAAVIAVPVGLLLIAVNLVAFQEPGPGDELGLVEIGDTIRRVDLDLFNALAVVSIAIILLSYLLVIGATYRAANDAYFGRPVEVGPSARTALRRFHSLLWITLLIALPFAIGALIVVLVPALALFLIAGALVVFVMLSVAIPALLAEDLRGTRALRRSWQLVRENGLRTFGVLFVAVVFTTLLQLIASLAAEAANGLAADQIGLWVVVVQSLTTLTLAVTAPFSAAVVTVIYYDLRIRKEGLDIELMTDSLEGGPAPAGDAPPDPFRA